jgi:hypothetical protein
MKTTFILLIDPQYIAHIIKVWIESEMSGNWQFCRSEKNYGFAIAIITVANNDYTEIKLINTFVNTLHCKLSSREGEQLMSYSGKFKEII